MGNVKYLVSRIAGLNYKQMFQKIDEVHEKSGKAKVRIFLDMVYCGIAYQAGYMDYALFEMYNLNRRQRKTVVTRGKNNAFMKGFNDPKYMPLIENKLSFNTLFSKYVKRDWLDLSKATFEQFQAFIERHAVFMAKPADGMCGKGIEKITASEHDAKTLFAYLNAHNLTLLEEVAVQHPDLMALHPYAVNTCRVITLLKDGIVHVIAAYLRIGNGNIVDNFNSGGMVVPINKETGRIEYPALDKAGNLYEAHPLTGVPIKGFVIPLWDQVLTLVKEAGLIVPQVGLVGWDVCVTKDGPILIEGNDFPGHDIYQLPPHRTDGIGVLPEFEKVINS